MRVAWTRYSRFGVHWDAIDERPQQGMFHHGKFYIVTSVSQ